MATTEALYKQCDICEAPFRVKIPKGWQITSYVVMGRVYAQIHLPSCPAGQPPTGVA